MEFYQFQTWLKNPKCHIICAASSNSAADVLAIRLMDDIPMSEILRLYAASFEKPRIPADLVPISTIFHQDTCTEELEKFRWVILK